MRSATFQLTASQGGWRLFVNRAIDKLDISTHSLTRRLTLSRLIFQPRIFSFQLTASQGGWPDSDVIIFCFTDYFNSQPHKEADVDKPSPEKTRYTFQLTASQGGWLFLGISCGCWKIISTHSLTRRLTMQKAVSFWRWKFQLTASQGGWQSLWSIQKNVCHFNSQPHKEADLLPDEVRRTTWEFQLTASQGGWRNGGVLIECSISYFNSQPHKEADEHVRFQYLRTTSFQLTASQGGWLFWDAVIFDGI